MTSDLYTVGAEDPIEMVANLMLWERIRHVPVEDKDHRLIGLVSYRGVLRHLAGGTRSRITSVRDIMKTEVTTVTPQTPTIEALRTMRRYRIGCLPVIQEDRLVGVITEEDFMDIASKLLEEQLGGGEPGDDDTEPDPAP